MTNKLTTLVLQILVCLSCIACDKQESLSLSRDLSLFAFIIADNDLDDHSEYIEHDLVNGLKGCPVGTELFLYLDRQNKQPLLRHFFLLESGKVGVNTVAEYDEQCSTSPEVFNNVLNTMISKSSGQRYGLIYWSHGNGWMPGFTYTNATSNTRAIGADGAYSMNVEDFDECLSRIKKPVFVVLDACYMGAVEVAYALRNSTDYLIASSAETLGVGFPYHLMIPDFVKASKESLSHSLDVYLDYCYTDYYGDGTISGMASLIDCNQMDGLASALRQIVKQVDSTNVKTDSIQVFEYSFPHLYYDLSDYVHSITSNSSLLAQFDQRMNLVVLKRVSTPSVYTQSGGKDSTIAIKHFSGLSTYIPETSFYDLAYEQTEWYKYCYEE